jgi:5-methylcytosine-specific restriction endonuclease McrA
VENMLDVRDLTYYLMILVIIVSVIHISLLLIVQQTSPIYKKLKDLNKKYMFEGRSIKKVSLVEKCSNKKEFDKAIIDDYLQKNIQNDLGTFDKIIDSNEETHKLYRAYVKEFNQLIPERIINTKFFKIHDIKLWIINYYERIILRFYKLRPTHYTKVSIKISYSSPQGKNNYVKQHEYSYDALKRHYDYVKEIMERRATRENIIRIERSKVTAGLRTEVLKRDNYRCKKCGATANDGVMLHVDHIIPVSKGGKTELTNLQTLCDSCNLGKSNKDN